jgi:hypothetical protein
MEQELENITGQIFGNMNKTEKIQKDTWTTEEVRKLCKEAVGLWRRYEDKNLYQSRKYFGKWFKSKIEIS